MTIRMYLTLALLLAALCAGMIRSADAAAAEVEKTTSVEIALPQSRSFLMTMSPFPYDFSPEAVDETYQTLKEHTDFTIHHFDDGIPWPEAFEGKPWPEHVQNEIASRIARRIANRPLFVAATPLNGLRDALAGYWSDQSNMQRPEGWKDKDLDDPDVITAYTNFCREMIKRFRPNYFAYGIEVNMLADKNPGAFEKFLTLARQTYDALKKENPELPLFLTIQIDDFDKHPDHFKDTVAKLVPLTDYVAMSSYPSGQHATRGPLPQNWFSRVAALAPGKPVVIAETGFIAEDLVLEKYGVEIAGSEALQADYVRFVLEQADALDACFVNWFVCRDFDPLWEKMATMGVDEVFKMFRDMGLFDETGQPRESLRVWDQWLALPKTTPKSE